jgi:chorismate dehydratase
MKKRLSVVSYLNSLPLGWGFLHGEQQGIFDLCFSVPSACADALASKQVDIGLIPAIEYQRIPQLAIIPGMALASKNSVSSVLIISRVPFEEIRSLASDTSSRTSLAMLKILFLEKVGRLPDLVQIPPDLSAMLKSHDAALLIGDSALQAGKNGFHVYDLAEEWIRMTGLPFVFAFWAVRGELSVPEKESFQASFEFGRRHLNEISLEQSTLLGIPQPDIFRYLTWNMNYSLDEDNLSGMRLFYQLAGKHGIIREINPLRFVG